MDTNETFLCEGQFFDSHGHGITVCFAPAGATVVMFDPDTLAVLSSQPLPPPPGPVFVGTGKQKLLSSMGAIYSYLDARDRFTVVVQSKQIWTFNARQLQVVVFRTDERLDPNEERIVCEVPVFDFPGGGAGALSNSVIGSRLSVIATNNTGYYFNWSLDPATKEMTPSLPGVERIDIDANGKGCHKIWTNTEVATTNCPRLSTRTGLLYTVSREIDQNGLDVYYWIALDYRTGEVVWQKMAGVGTNFDAFYSGVSIGPTGILYYGGYGGLMMLRDTP